MMILKYVSCGLLVLLSFSWKVMADDFFKIAQNSDKQFSSFDRKLEVFGIPIYAVPAVENQKLLHAANVMAQYLDNDEDGIVDNPKVIQAMLDHRAFLVMWKDESDLENLEVPENMIGQDLGNDETLPDWHIKRQQGQFDAALEEVWHLISVAGYARAYPDIFGEQPDTAIANAMDQARGGRFLQVPRQYPQEAWYSYDDETCDYRCMISEYFYWAMTSILGAQKEKERLDEIQDEWRLNTRELVKERDPAIYQLLTDPQYRLPTKLPNGQYRHEQF